MKTVYLAVFVISLGFMSCGLYLGWTSPSLSLLLGENSPVPLTSQDVTWITSIFFVGGEVGAILSTCTVNIIGRKLTLLFSVAPALVGWMMIAFATAAWELWVGRFVCGLSNGLGYVAGIMYVGEISPADVRGILTCTLTVATKFGILAEWVIGPFLYVRDLALVSLLFPVLFFVGCVWIPESPYHLMRRGRYDEAITSLVQLRGTTDVSKEAEIIEKSVKIDLANNTGLWELLSVSGNRKALIVVLGLTMVQQCSGNIAIVSYAELIFNATNSNFEGKYVTMILGAVQVACTMISASIGDCYTRRSLLIFSTFGVSIATFLVGLFFFLQSIEINVDNITWLPALAAIFYIFMYAFGLAALPYTMLSELFPTNVKALAITIGIICISIFGILINVIYQYIVVSYGVHVAFWFFSISGFLGVIFVFFYVPDTKGKTLQEIQQYLHAHK